MDDRPEWKDFNDAEDIVKGGPAKSRSGLVAVDETRYIGGLQPTTLSKNAFGENSGGYKLSKIRKQLKSTNKKLDHLMEKRHKKALQDAKLERKIQLQSVKRESEWSDGDRSLRPEFENLVLQEEEDAHRMHAALYADKWSLERAILLHGTSNDENREGIESSQKYPDREELLSQMDSTLQKASLDLYTAYSITTIAAKKLHLPDRVMNEVVHRLVRYAIRRDGFSVKGIASRLSKDVGNQSKQDRKAAEERLKEYNKAKQISSLGAAILFLTARNLGWTRTIGEICECFGPPVEYTTEKTFLKPKHCSRALSEIKTFFPEYARTPSGSTVGESHQATPCEEAASTSNFADHYIRKLQLPPVAEASVRVLLAHCRNEQLELGQNSGTKISTLCAAVTYFVCTVGSVMQRVAQQVHIKNNTKTLHGKSSRKRLHCDYVDTGNVLSKKRLKHDKTQTPFDDAHGYLKDDLNNDEPFDAFTHPAIVENTSEKLEYDMRRMWDTWAEQMPWSRSLVEVEQSCGVSRHAMEKLYKLDLFPRRDLLLTVLNDAVSRKQAPNNFGSHSCIRSLQQTPLASILLAHISTAGDLMNDK
jgi:transcription initiation factor TFIIIB Brf1 subunit/transcription initiation factor TFIIB